ANEQRFFSLTVNLLELRSVISSVRWSTARQLTNRLRCRQAPSLADHACVAHTALPSAPRRMAARLIIFDIMIAIVEKVKLSAPGGLQGITGGSQPALRKPMRALWTSQRRTPRRSPAQW